MSDTNASQDAEFIASFYSRIERLESGCWKWKGAIHSEGYGKVRMNRKTIGTHRASWIISNGPIPDGHFVCHRCDNRYCVNPDHLFLGTHRDNMNDMSAKGRKFKTLTPQEVLDIRKSTLDDKSTSLLYGVKKRVIRHVRRYKETQAVGGVN